MISISLLWPILAFADSECNFPQRLTLKELVSQQERLPNEFSLFLALSSLKPQVIVECSTCPEGQACDQPCTSKSFYEFKEVSPTGVEAKRNRYIRALFDGGIKKIGKVKFKAKIQVANSKEKSFRHGSTSLEVSQNLEFKIVCYEILRQK